MLQQPPLPLQGPPQSGFTPFNITVIVLDGIHILLSLILLGLSIWKRNKQPLKSRGILPFLGLVGFITVSVSRIVSNAGMGYALDEAACFMIIYDILPVFLCIQLVSMIQTFRYLFIQNINKHKQNTVIQLLLKKDENIEITKTQVIIAKLAKIFSSNYGVFAEVVIYFIVWCIVVSIVWASTVDVRCPFTFQGHVILILFLVFAALNWALILGVIIYDCVKNFNLVKTCSWRKFLWDNDPLRFRIEFILYFIVGTISVIMICAPTVFAIYAQANRPPPMGSSSGPPPPPPGPNDTRVNPVVIQDLLLSCVQFLYLFTISLYALIFTFIWERTSYVILNDEYTSELKDVLENPQTSKMFKEFARAEWSIENVLCYEAMKKFYGLKPNAVEERKKYASDIYETFFKEGAPLDVNVDKTIREGIRKGISDNQVDDSLFQAAMSQITTNMSDTFSRFRRTKEYLTFVENEGLQKEMLEKL